MDVIDIYYQGADVRATGEDFYDLTRAYLEMIHARYVHHIENFIDP